MASNVRLVLNHREIARLLNGEGQYRGVAVDLRKRAERVASQAGPGMEVLQGESTKRATARVVTGTVEAMEAEARDRRLTRAIDAAR
jgi:hypothetical protein